jgi:hypothetical protein
MILRILSIALLAFTLAVPGVTYAGETVDDVTIGNPKKGDPDKKHKKHKKGGKKHKKGKKGGKKGKKGGKKGKKGGKKNKQKKGDRKDRRHNNNRRFN